MYVFLCFLFNSNLMLVHVVFNSYLVLEALLHVVIFKLACTVKHCYNEVQGTANFTSLLA